MYAKYCLYLESFSDVSKNFGDDTTWHWDNKKMILIYYA